MNKEESIIKHHLSQYPSMAPQDIVKLLYQASFGPRHLAHEPSKKTLKTYLEEELKHASFFPLESLVEPIGHHYFRVSLQAISKNLITKNELVEAFYASMRHPFDEIEALKRFEKAVRVCTRMLDEGSKVTRKNAFQSYVRKYLKTDIVPVHHSEVYRNTYHPHYRVIHRNYLPKKLIVEIKEIGD